MIAALFVEKGGVYYGLPDVDPWDQERDARLYAGPWPVVAHPPCARWSRLAGFTEARFGYKRGADEGCFEAALCAVRKFGGVLEHPAHTAAFKRFGLPRPSRIDGWTCDLYDRGAVCYVEQGRYGLPVKKATWLYAYGVELTQLRWGMTPDSDGDEPNGPHGGIDNWRDRWQKAKEGNHPRALAGAWRVNRHNGMRSATPPAFRDLLLDMARSVRLEAASMAERHELPRTQAD